MTHDEEDHEREEDIPEREQESLLEVREGKGYGRRDRPGTGPTGTTGSLLPVVAGHSRLDLVRNACPSRPSFRSAPQLEERNGCERRNGSSAQLHAKESRSAGRDAAVSQPRIS